MSLDVFVPTIFLLVIAGTGRVVTGSWLSPGAFFAIIWSFVVIFSLSSPLFGAPMYPVWTGALWWIDLQVFMLLVGDLIGQHNGGRPLRPRDPQHVSNHESTPLEALPYPRSILLICGLCTISWMIIVDRIEGGGGQPPTPLQIVLAFHYAGGIFGGLIFAAAKSRWLKGIGLLGLLPGIIASVFLAGRTAVVAHFTFWFSGYFAMRLFLSTKRVHLFTKGRVAAATVSLFLFLLIGVLVKPFRGVPRGLLPAERIMRYSEVLDQSALDDSWEFMKPGYFGHISSFSWYFERAWHSPPPLSRPGEQTFCGIYRLLGIDLTPALYTQVGGIDTNVFTIFKPLIEDYSLVGSALVFLLIGILSGWSFRQLIDGKKLWPAAFLVMYYTNAMNAGGWFFNYNSITGSYILSGLYLLWLQARLQHQSRNTMRILEVVPVAAEAAR